MSVDECGCPPGPWVTTSMLDMKSAQSITCPDNEHCLRGAPIINGRIDEHFRNVPGTCPWIGVYVLPELPACGHPPQITTRQMRYPVTRADNHPRGAIEQARCLGCYRVTVPIENGRYSEHRGGTCPWIGAVILDQGHYPPIHVPERA